MKSRFEKARKTLIFWTLFIGLGAVGGAACMLIDPSGKALGMDAMLPFFQKMPLAELLFQDFVFSGISLLIVNGLTNLTAAVLLLRRKHAGVVLGGVFGVTLMLWICIQFWLFPLNFMSTLYFFFGLAQALTGYAAWVFDRQENFTVRREDYPHIGETPNGWWCTFPAWVTCAARPLRKRNAPARRSMRSRQRSARRERWASGGAAAMECTAGQCPFRR